MFISGENVQGMMLTAILCCDTHSLVCPDLGLTFPIGEGRDPDLRICYLRPELLGFLRYTHGHAIYLRNNNAMVGDNECEGYESWSPEIHGYGNEYYSREMSDTEIAEYVRTGYLRPGLDL